MKQMLTKALDEYLVESTIKPTQNMIVLKDLLYHVYLNIVKYVLHSYLLEKATIFGDKSR